MAVLDLLLGGGGVWLVLLCGSWLYLTLGLALVVAGVLLIRDSPAALWAYGLIVLATLDWARWEMGLDWWPLTARGNIVVLIGVFLTPWITRPLGGWHGDGAQSDGAPEPTATAVPLPRPAGAPEQNVGEVVAGTGQQYPSAEGRLPGLRGICL